MTEAQEKARDERLAAARAEKAKRALARTRAAEKAIQEKIAVIGDRLDPEDGRKLEYITSQIASGKREDEDVRSLRETRNRILRNYRMEEAAA